MPEKDYTFNQQLILEAVKSTYGIPTVALGALAATGAFAGLKFLDFLTTLTLPEIPELPTVPTVTEILDNLGVGIVGEERPRFASDGIACLGAHPKQIIFLGQKINDPLRMTKVAACMVRKGWGGDVVLQWLRDLFK